MPENTITGITASPGNLTITLGDSCDFVYPDNHSGMIGNIVGGIGGAGFGFVAGVLGGPVVGVVAGVTFGAIMAESVETVMDDIFHEQYREDYYASQGVDPSYWEDPSMFNLPPLCGGVPAGDYLFGV